MLKNLLSAVMLSGLLLVGCGSSDEGSSSEEEGPKYFEIMNAEKTYSMDLYNYLSISFLRIQ